MEGALLAADQCLDVATLERLRMMLKLAGRNASEADVLLTNLSCADSNRTPISASGDSERADLAFYDLAENVYAFVTPIIVIVGIIGNSLSMRVFTSKMMRKLSGSYYLGSLAASDMAVLLTYVTLEWLNYGMHKWPGGWKVSVLHIDGVCQTFLFFSYLFRFLSAWFIVIFTMERYIGVCRPFKRREHCTVSFARRTVLGIVLVGVLVSVFKPVLSSVGSKMRASQRDDGLPDQFCGGTDLTSFALDSCYALVITALPFVIIATLNLLIVRTLLVTRRRHKRDNILTEENFLKLEFTFVILVLSTVFIALSLPYFVLWCQRWLQQLEDRIHPGHVTLTLRMRGALLITKTIFFLNYSANFFLYSVTGAHFRKQLRDIVRGGGSSGKARARWTTTRTTAYTQASCVTNTSPRHSVIESTFTNNVNINISRCPNVIIKSKDNIVEGVYTKLGSH